MGFSYYFAKFTSLLIFIPFGFILYVFLPFAIESKNPVIITFVLLFSLLMLLFILSNTPLGRKIWIYLYKKDLQKQSKLYKIEQNFKKAENEETIIELSPAILYSFGFFGQAISPRSIILTNLRLILGISISPAKKSLTKEKLGIINFWKPSIKNPPNIEDRVEDFGEIIGNFLQWQAKKINIRGMKLIGGSDPRIVIKTKAFGIPYFYVIYHPKAEKIYNTLNS